MVTLVTIPSPCELHQLVAPITTQWRFTAAIILFIFFVKSDSRYRCLFFVPFFPLVLCESGYRPTNQEILTTHCIEGSSANRLVGWLVGLGSIQPFITRLTSLQFFSLLLCLFISKQCGSFQKKIDTPGLVEECLISNMLWTSAYFISHLFISTRLATGWFPAWVVLAYKHSMQIVFMYNIYRMLVCWLLLRVNNCADNSKMNINLECFVFPLEILIHCFFRGQLILPYFAFFWNCLFFVQYSWHIGTLLFTQKPRFIQFIFLFWFNALCAFCALQCLDQVCACVLSLKKVLGRKKEVLSSLEVLLSSRRCFPSLSRLCLGTFFFCLKISSMSCTRLLYARLSFFFSLLRPKTRQ